MARIGTSDLASEYKAKYGLTAFVETGCFIGESMGIVKKLLAKADIEEKRGSFILFELNVNDIVHIQNETWRLEMSIPEFKQFAHHCVVAGQKLIASKGIKDV